MMPADLRWLWARLLCALASMTLSLVLIFFVNPHAPLRLALSLVTLALRAGYFAPYPLARRQR